MNKEIKLGSIIAYINIALNLLINIFLTPFLITRLGDGEYGVYKIIQSFTAQLSIMSFGIATLVTRYVVYYNTLDQKKEKENFLFMAKIVSIILAVMIGIVGNGLFFTMDGLYEKTLSEAELATAKILFIILVVNVAITVIGDFYNGLMRAHEKFVLFNSLNTVRAILRVFSIVIFLNIGIGSIGIVATDLGITILMILITSIYCRTSLKEKAVFHYFDKQLLKSSVMFSAAIFLQAIVSQVNQNLDNIILGSMVGTTVVTMYSCGLMLFTSFNSLVTVVGGMYGPKATKLVAEGADGEELTEFSVSPARIQLMIAGLGISGFILFGQNFISIWLGEGFEDVYGITLILIIPAVLPLVESITNNILDAKLKRMARSLILLIMCVVNIGVSIILIKAIGYIGAAFGTALSLIVGHGLIMNIYLHKKIGLNVIRMFKGIFERIVPAIIVSIVLGIPLHLLPNSLLFFGVKALMFCVIYFYVMFYIGMNKSEKKLAYDFLRKIKLNMVIKKP